MKDLRKEVSELAFYLQRLTEPSVLSEVQDAVSRKDEARFVRACEKMKIPRRYIYMLAATVFAVGIQVTWPPG